MDDHRVLAPESAQASGAAGDDRDDDAGAAMARRRRWPWVAVSLVVVIAVMSAVVVVGRERNTVRAAFVDHPAPPLAGRTLDGSRFDLGDHRGSVAVVNVWASWCTICKEEHPELEAAARRLSARRVQFVGLDTMDNAEAARDFLDEMGGSSYPSVVDRDGRKARAWGVIGVPTTFIVDARGRVRARALGAVNERWIVNTVERFSTAMLAD